MLLCVSFTMFINMLSYGQDPPRKSINIEPRETQDSLKVSIDSLLNPEKSIKETDSTVKDSVKPKTEFLTDIVEYHALEYVSFNRKKQQLYLYNIGEVTYGDMNIKAGEIIIDYSKNEVYAKGIIDDSTGVYVQKPVFTQGQNVIEPDSLRFNTDTERALIYKSQTEQGDGTIVAQVTKRENDSLYFIADAIYTTSQNLDDPEYYIKIRKGKVVPDNKIVTSLANLFFYNVPTPIGIPFGFFPLTKTHKSGVLMPTYSDSRQRGFSLQNGGYYFAISDYVDLALTGDYYTNGSYGIRAESNYAWRYKFRGNFGLRYENQITSERGFPDYSRATIYNIRWSHSQDTKSNPSSRFSASVNLGSSNYYRESYNQLTSSNFMNNTLSSSISYSKTFQGEPQVNLSVTATHSQNTNTEQINMTLPTFQGSVSRIFPFAPKSGSKKGIIQNINLQYNLRAENRIQTTDSLFFKQEMWDDARAGFRHSIPISTNFKVFKYFSVSASTSYDETWVFKTVEKYFDQVNSEVVTEDVKGFDAYRTYNFSTSLGTTIYGMFNFEKEGKDRKIKAIRHVMRPGISYNINPAFDQYYETYEVVSADGLTTSEVEYSRFENSIYGAPGKTYSSSLGINLSNNFEAKVKDKDSTATEAKKITLLNNLNFSTSYNLAGDSLNWSPLRVTGGTSFFNNKMSVNFGMTLDPYALDNNNRKINTFNIDNGGSLFRMTSANMTMNYTLSSDLFSKDKKNDRGIEENLRSGGREDDLFGKTQDFADSRYREGEEEEEEGPVELYNSKIPWSLRLAYAVNYSNSRRENTISSHSLMFSGDIELTPRWTVGASSGYDFKNKGFTYTQLRFERDLLSWRMSFSWIPFSTRTSWYFFVGIKSNLLKDLKYDKRREPDQRL